MKKHRSATQHSTLKTWFTWCTFKNTLVMVLIFLHLLISLRCSTDYKESLLTRYNGYPSLKRVTKTFLEKVQHRSATC